MRGRGGRIAPGRSKPFLDEAAYFEVRGYRRFACGEKALDIFREDVAFQIHRVVRRQIANVRMLVGEWDYSNVGDAVLPAGDGEADAVDGDGAFSAT